MGQGWLHVPRQHFFDRTFPPDLLLQLICPMRSPSSAANVPSSIFTDFTNMASEVSGMITMKTMPIVDHKQHSTCNFRADLWTWKMQWSNFAKLKSFWSRFDTLTKVLVTIWHIGQVFCHVLTHWPRFWSHFDTLTKCWSHFAQNCGAKNSGGRTLQLPGAEIIGDHCECNHTTQLVIAWT